MKNHKHEGKFEDGVVGKLVLVGEESGMVFWLIMGHLVFSCGRWERVNNKWNGQRN